MGRFSPKSLAETFIGGVEQRKVELLEYADSIKPDPSIQDLRESYNQKIYGTLARTALGGTVDLIDRGLLGTLKSANSAIESGVSAVSMPFGLLGTRERLFTSSSQFLRPSPVHSNFTSYGKMVGFDLLQVLIGYGSDESQKWETGLGGLLKWTTSSIGNIGRNALTLRPIGTANAISKTFGDGFDLVKNTVVSTVPFASNLVLGGIKTLARKGRETVVTSQPSIQSPSQSNKPEEDFNPGDLF